MDGGIILFLCWLGSLSFHFVVHDKVKPKMGQVHPIVCFLAQPSVDQRRPKSLQPSSIHLPPVDTNYPVCQVVPLYATVATSDDESTSSFEFTSPIPEYNEFALAMANSLVETNIEFGEDKLQLVGTEKFAITITPAITLILYAIAGIPTTLLPGWRAADELAGLYAVRQLMLASMEKYENEISCDEQSLKAIKQTLEQVCSYAQDKLDESLESIQPLALQTKIKPEPDQSGKILVPMVGRSTVLINGEKASFADVIKPYMLIQTKQKSSECNKPVDMLEELEKCNLLKSCDDDRLLRGLVELWRGK